MSDNKYSLVADIDLSINFSKAIMNGSSDDLGLESLFNLEKSSSYTFGIDSLHYLQDSFVSTEGDITCYDLLYSKE